MSQPEFLLLGVHGDAPLHTPLHRTREAGVRDEEGRLDWQGGEGTLQHVKEETFDFMVMSDRE